MSSSSWWMTLATRTSVPRGARTSPHRISTLWRRMACAVPGYVSCPYCSPTRAGLLTGRYQQRFGHEFNPVYAPDNAKIGLPLDQVTVADAMKLAGYATG